MAGQVARGSNFAEIMKLLFGQLRAEAPFLAGLIGVLWVVVFGIQLASRALAGVPALGGNSSVIQLAVTLLTLVIAAIAGAIVYRRLFRRAAGGAGTIWDDIAIDGPLAATVVTIALIISGATMVQLAAAILAPGVVSSLVTMVAGIASLVILLNWCFATTAAVERRRGLADALATSRRVISGRRWLVVGCYLLVGLVIGLPSVMLVMSHMQPGVTNPAEILASYSLVDLGITSAVNQVGAVVSMVLQYAMYTVLQHGQLGLPSGAAVSVFD
jgi:hypothetical protein